MACGSSGTIASASQPGKGGRTLYSLQLLIALAQHVLFLADQTAENPLHSPTYDLATQAEALGIDPEAARFLVLSLAHVQTRKPTLYAATVERPGDSDSDSVIVAYSKRSLARALAEENRIFHDTEDETTRADGDFGRVITEYDWVTIQ